MAIVNCPECAKQISSLATTCPNCGAPIADKKFRVHFERKSRILGKAIKGNIFVDGSFVGPADHGSSFDLMLTSGRHSIVVRTNHTRKTTSSSSFSIPENAKYISVEIDIASFGQALLNFGDYLIVSNVTTR